MRSWWNQRCDCGAKARTDDKTISDDSTALGGDVSARRARILVDHDGVDGPIGLCKGGRVTPNEFCAGGSPRGTCAGGPDAARPVAAEISIDNLLAVSVSVEIK